MSATTIENPTASHPARQLALGSYVERIRTWCDEHALEGEAGSFLLRTGDRTLSFEPAEFALIHHSALVAAETGQPADRLVVEAIGFVLKSHEDLQRLRAASDPASTEFHTVQAELMLDGALGAALLAEIQARGDDLVSRGQIEQARMVSKFNQRVWNAVAEVEKPIAGSERERSRALAECLTDRPLTAPCDPTTAPETPAPPVADLPEPPEANACITELSLTPPPSPEELPQAIPSLTTMLGAALFLATLVWFGFFGPLRSNDATSQELTLGAFDGLLSGIDAHSPSLFGTVNQARWEGLDAQARREVVDRVSEVLVNRGYSGALLRTEDGVPVAQWLEQRGSLLLENRESP